MEKGFGPEWALLISAAVYAGSMQFAMLGLMTAPFSPVTTVMMTLLVNARHLFYGLSHAGTLRQGEARQALPDFLPDGRDLLPGVRRALPRM